jgi:hypothetical protein
MLSSNLWRHDSIFANYRPELCLGTDSIHQHGFQLRHRERPAPRQRQSAQSLYPGLRGWRELRRHLCHHGTCRKNFSARASCRCRSAGILAAPEQQQPMLETHKIVQQPVNQFRKNQNMCLKCLISLVVFNFSPSDSNG